MFAELGSDRTRVKRMPERGRYERKDIHAILDEALICHVGFVHDDQPFVIPTIHARVDDRLYLHGSPGSRMLRGLKAGAPVCVTATLLDGLVLARSALHHSMNYRSVVVVGRAAEVTDAEEKISALRAVVEHVTPGRWEVIRRPSTREFRRTEMLYLDLKEASAKVRSGPPVDEDEDMDLPVWAGVLPLETRALDAESDPQLSPGIDIPHHVLRWGSVSRRLRYGLDLGEE